MGADAHSIHNFANITLAQPELFSRDALTARRMGGATERPEWLDAFVAGAWVPNGANDLRHLKKELKPYTQKFEDVYRPIRNASIAHRTVIARDKLSHLFERTSRIEIGEILDFHHDLANAIEGLYMNGLNPALGTRADACKLYNQRIKDEAKGVLSGIVASTREEAN